MSRAYSFRYGCIGASMPNATAITGFMFAPFAGNGCVRDLHSTLTYNPESGDFRWLNPPKKARVRPGDLAGTVTSCGYVVIKACGGSHRAHRLAWLFTHGTWPQEQIDHINGNRADNRIANLRDVPARVNSENRHRANVNNSTRLLGVSKERSRFCAVIRVQGKAHYLGSFDTAESAHQAYLTAKARLHDGWPLSGDCGRAPIQRKG